MRRLANIVGALGLAVLALVGVREVVQIARSGVSCSVPNNLQNGTTADATQVMANFNALVACFGNAASAGANSDITSLTGLTTPLSAGQGGAQLFWGGTATGTVNAQVITTVTPSSGFSKTANFRVCWVPVGINTGTTQINVNGTGLTNLQRLIQLSTGISAAGVLVGGELTTQMIACAVYTGSVYQLDNRGIDYVGEIKDFGYAGCPTGWQEVTGANVSSTNFPDIFTALGTTWGTSAGNTVMPDLRGSATYSRDISASARITVAGGNIDGTVVGGTQYQQNKVVQKVNLAAFSLTVTDPGHVHGVGARATDIWGTSGNVDLTFASGGAGINVGKNSGTASATTGVTVASGGSSTPMSILPNAAIVTKCVKL